MSNSRSRIAGAVLELAGFLVVIVVNVLANAVPLGGKTTGELSDLYPNLFVPAGLTFAIWGVIYLLLGIYVVYGLVRAARDSQASDGSGRKIGVLFLITCAMNAGWIFAWQYQALIISLLCMVVLLLTLILIYERLQVGRSATTSAEKYLVHLPMSVYLGWISIATIANVTAVLVAYKWNRFGIGEQIWAVIMIAVGIALGLYMAFSRRDVFYTLVIDWAVLGILIKRTSEENGAAHAVVVTTIVGVCLLTVAIVVQILRKRVYRPS